MKILLSILIHFRRCRDNLLTLNEFYKFFWCFFLLGCFTYWTWSRSILRSQSSIQDATLLTKIVSSFQPFTIFAKKLHRRCRLGFQYASGPLNTPLNTPLGSIFEMKLLMYSVPWQAYLMELNSFCKKELHHRYLTRS